MRIGVFSPGILKSKSGGTITSTLNLCLAMKDRGHKIYVYGFETKDDAAPVRTLPSWLSLRVCSSSGSHESIKALHSQLLSDDLDVAISIDSYKYHLFWTTAVMGTSIPLVYSERSDPERIESIWSRAGRLAAMSGADFIHILLPEYKNSLPPFLQDRVKCIINPAPKVAENISVNRYGPPYVICSLGRIAKEKEIPLLIKAFTQLSTNFPDWELHIWGEDTPEVNIHHLLRKNPAKNRIRLCGLTHEPLKVFQKSHIFCIQSRYEGTPLALLEAFSCGLPAVGIGDCPGVRSVIIEGENGFLSWRRSPEALAETLKLLMNNSELREKLGHGALETAKKRTPDFIWDQWEKLLFQAHEHKGNTVMDTFSNDPFLYRAKLSTLARKENALRKFGDPLVGSLGWIKQHILNSLGFLPER